MADLKITYSGDGTPFSRAVAYNRKFNQALRGELTGVKMDSNGVLAALGPYESRGHARGVYRGSRLKIAARMKKQSSAHHPHQGKQEIARRLKRLEAAHG